LGTTAVCDPSEDTVRKVSLRVICATAADLGTGGKGDLPAGSYYRIATILFRSLLFGNGDGTCSPGRNFLAVFNRKRSGTLRV
jgi:hypothetical protein